MKLRTCVVVAVSLFSFVLTAAAQGVDAALTAAIAARDKAAIARNADEVAKYTADDYFAINPGGVLTSKKQRIDGLRAPAAAGATPQPAQRTEAVRMYGANVAVARMKVTDNRQLIVWVKNPQGWQAAAIHIVPDAVPTTPLTPQERPKTPQPSQLKAPAGLTGDRAAVFSVFKQIQDAFYAGDRATYEKLTSREHVRLNPGGLVRFFSENMGIIDGPRNQPKDSNISVQVWGQLAVVRWLETNSAGQAQWLTRVFAKNPSGWQQVATASSFAGNPPIAP